jgi:hypothetical protein
MVRELGGPAMSVSLLEGSLSNRLASLLGSLPAEPSEHCFNLDELSLRLGMPLPEQAQTATFWQRGDLGRSVRGLGYRVQVRYAQVIFLGEGTDRGA